MPPRPASTLVCLSLVAALPGAAAAGVCVTNGTDHAALFVAEARGAAQVSARLAPGETLCSGPGPAPGGVVRVFESAEDFEGCARLVPDGATDTLLAYAEFDRCRWSSHAD